MNFTSVPHSNSFRFLLFHEFVCCPCMFRCRNDPPVPNLYPWPLAGGVVIGSTQAKHRTVIILKILDLSLYGELVSARKKSSGLLTWNSTKFEFIVFNLSFQKNLNLCGGIYDGNMPGTATVVV